MHKRHMGDIAIGKDHLLYLLFEDQLFKVLFRIDGNTAGVERPAQRWRTATIFDSWDLSGGERHDFIFRMFTKAGIEGVKISACRTHDEDSLPIGAGA
jgi:hypothetical protein